MAQYLEQLRHACALGSMQSVLAIRRAAPILHAGQGCVSKLGGAIGSNNGFHGSGYVGGTQMPCTNIGETEVVFGGEEKLRQTIENSLKIIDADLFIVLTGCVPEIVGDDAGEVVKQFQQQGKPVVYAETGGFNGTNYIGHEIVVDAVIDQYLKPAESKEAGLVNIWSVVPFQDAFWLGNLKEIEKLVRELSLIPNIIFGLERQGIEALNKVPKAQFNLLISPWVGLKNVRHLEEKFGTPYLHYPVLPIGPTETGNFLRTLGSFAGIASEKIEAVIYQHEREYYSYIESALEAIYQTRIVPNRFITVADSFYSLGISRFLINDMGLIPETQFVTDGVLPEYQGAIEAEFKKFNDGIEAKVLFSNDGGWVQEEIRNIELTGRPLILGSSWEKVFSKKVNGFHLSVSMPVGDRLVLNSFYVGYHGALKLLEDIYSEIISNSQNP
ncbi:MAG TPA: nitrogenase component 1 [Methylomusa anaerophila]|uniref:Nitrogenase molybdenum-iron protein beta chain n=1 Tax=Methylomusa anaerophila TaxID=1930071 RepID=A0A348AEN5_9FIRM|nr:nitrogenase component 1 [Methylomusa anaerophila]BBB89533.1 nitrogenase molybdenum-iron protein beta chain [Methylomusa anaerophila]HML90097.1 nitrogenase component 1 [Methylomusa anaerophila]